MNCGTVHILFEFLKGRKGGKETEEIKDNMAKNLPNVMKTLNTQFQESQ